MGKNKKLISQYRFSQPTMSEQDVGGIRSGVRPREDTSPYSISPFKNYRQSKPDLLLTPCSVNSGQVSKLDLRVVASKDSKNQRTPVQRIQWEELLKRRVNFN